MRLRRTKDLRDFTIAATDADIGTVSDLYFDDDAWTIRYLVVETGELLSRRKVLISPLAFRRPALRSLHVWVNLTWQQVESCPSFDLHKPVSRRREIDYHDHFGWPYYWQGTDVWGSTPHPQELASLSAAKRKTRATKSSGDAHLQSTEEVIGYHVLAQDGPIGHIEDFLFDDETWQIRYAIIDTRKWWRGKRTLIRPQWIERVNWKDRQVYAGVSRDRVRNSPPWDPSRPLSRKYELRLHQYYDSPPYWTAANSARSNVG